LGLSGEPDPLTSATRGAALGALDWTKEQVALFATKLRNRELAFIRDVETINLVRQERQNPEWQVLKEHIKDQRLRVLVTVGLTLRRLEKDRKNTEKIQDLRMRIHNKHGTPGLRAAELVQRGILGLFFMRFLRETESPADIQHALETLLKKVEEYTAFVQEKDDLDALSKELRVRVLARVPYLFIILGYGSQKTRAKRVLDKVLKVLPGTFDAERHETANDFFGIIGRVEGDELRIVLPID